MSVAAFLVEQKEIETLKTVEPTLRQTGFIGVPSLQSRPVSFPYSNISDQSSEKATAEIDHLPIKRL